MVKITPKQEDNIQARNVTIIIGKHSVVCITRKYIKNILQVNQNKLSTTLIRKLIFYITRDGQIYSKEESQKMLRPINLIICVNATKTKYITNSKNHITSAIKYKDKSTRQSLRTAILNLIYVIRKLFSKNNKNSKQLLFSKSYGGNK